MRASLLLLGALGLLSLTVGCAAEAPASNSTHTDPHVDGADGADGADGTDGTDGTEPVELGLDPNCSPFNMAGECLSPWP